MNEYYGLLRLHSNFFLPQTKLIGKIRNGNKVRKKYDNPKTPYHRLLENDKISLETKEKLQKIFAALNPAELQRKMAAALECSCLLACSYHFRERKSLAARFRLPFRRTQKKRVHRLFEKDRYFMTCAQPFFLSGLQKKRKETAPFHGCFIMRLHRGATKFSVAPLVFFRALIYAIFKALTASRRTNRPSTNRRTDKARCANILKKPRVLIARGFFIYENFIFCLCVPTSEKCAIMLDCNPVYIKI